MGGRHTGHCGESDTSVAKRREMGGNESASCCSNGGGGKKIRFNARIKYRSPRSFSLHTKCPSSGGLGPHRRPRDENREGGFSGDRYRSTGEKRLHASFPRDR